MPDLSSVAREAAHELERQLPGDSYADGWADCASRLPSEAEIARALAVADGQVLSGLTDHMLDFMYGVQARGVLSLIGEKISG